MRYLKLSDAADIKFCSVAPARMKTQEEKTKWLSCSNFVADNGVVGEPTLTNFVPDESFAIRPEDIIIKRITPGYVNYISDIPLTQPEKVQAKIRYQAKKAEAMLYPLADDRVRLVFDEPQRAITPGQSVVFYNNDTVIGGGVVVNAEN